MKKNTEKNIVNRCSHKNWRPADYKHEVGVNKVTSSIYEVYCNDCHNFVNLLSGEIVNDKGLVWVD